MGARNRVEIGLLYRSTRLHWLAESLFLELIAGLLKSLKIPSLIRGGGGGGGGEFMGQIF
jgi:hypothetical protein